MAAIGDPWLLGLEQVQGGVAGRPAIEGRGVLTPCEAIELSYHGVREVDAVRRGSTECGAGHIIVAVAMSSPYHL